MQAIELSDNYTSLARLVVHTQPHRCCRRPGGFRTAKPGTLLLGLVLKLLVLQLLWLLRLVVLYDVVDKA